MHTAIQLQTLRRSVSVLFSVPMLSAVWFSGFLLPLCRPRLNCNGPVLFENLNCHISIFCSGPHQFLATPLSIKPDDFRLRARKYKKVSKGADHWLPDELVALPDLALDPIIGALYKSLGDFLTPTAGPSQCYRAHATPTQHPCTGSG